MLKPLLGLSQEIRFVPYFSFLVVYRLHAFSPLQQCFLSYHGCLILIPHLMFLDIKAELSFSHSFIQDRFLILVDFGFQFFVSPTPLTN